MVKAYQMLDFEYRRLQARINTLEIRLGIVAQERSDANSGRSVWGNEVHEDFVPHDESNLQRLLTQYVTMVRNAKVVSLNGQPTETVELGTSVTVKRKQAKKTETFYIIGIGLLAEDDNEVSFESPLARGLMGARVGETRTFSVPAGQRVYRVMKIEAYHPDSNG